MAAINNTKKPRVAETWKLPGSAEGLGSDEQIAHAILAERRDLLPSVERIMTAALTPEQRSLALHLFRDSLHVTGDPNRDPRIAIARAQR